MCRLALTVALCACSTAVLIEYAHADDSQPAAITKMLLTKDFWDGAGAKGGRAWSASEGGELKALSQTSKDPTIRLRAGKVLVDLAGDSKLNVDKNGAAIVAAAFRHLEGQLATAEVQLLLERGFTHYAVSPAADGSVWFLIEHVEADGFNGGLNLHWDPAQKSFAETKAWGDVTAAK